jgi:hypothetical protein
MWGSAGVVPCCVCGVGAGSDHDTMGIKVQSAVVKWAMLMALSILDVTALLCHNSEALSPQGHHPLGARLVGAGVLPAMLRVLWRWVPPSTHSPNAPRRLQQAPPHIALLFPVSPLSSSPFALLAHPEPSWAWRALG